MEPSKTNCNYPSLRGDHGCITGPSVFRVRLIIRDYRTLRAPFCTIASLFPPTPSPPSPLPPCPLHSRASTALLVQFSWALQSPVSCMGSWLRKYSPTSGDIRWMGHFLKSSWVFPKSPGSNSITGSILQVILILYGNLHYHLLTHSQYFPGYSKRRTRLSLAIWSIITVSRTLQTPLLSSKPLWPGKLAPGIMLMMHIWQKK